MPESRKRLTARRVEIKDITNGSYHKEEGFSPNYILTDYGLKVSRALIVATVVDKFVNEEGSYGALVIDDGTDTIRCKYFQDVSDVEKTEVGTILELVGKVKQYNDELYVAPELTTERGPNWEILRKLESQEIRQKWEKLLEKVNKLKEEESDEDIINRLKSENLSEEEIKPMLSMDEEKASSGQEERSGDKQEVRSEDGSSESSDQDEDLEKKVLELVKELDDGEGCDYSEVIDQMDVEDDKIESVINDLLSDGTCYEPRPGKIKVL